MRRKNVRSAILSMATAMATEVAERRVCRPSTLLLVCYDRWERDQPAAPAGGTGRWFLRRCWPPRLPPSSFTLFFYPDLFPLLLPSLLPSFYHSFLPYRSPPPPSPSLPACTDSKIARGGCAGVALHRLRRKHPSNFEWDSRPCPVTSGKDKARAVGVVQRAGGARDPRGSSSSFDIARR